MTNNRKTILEVDVPKESKQDILEKILKYTRHNKEFVHVVSLNPEIMVEAFKARDFRGVVAEAQVKIVDGVGVVLAGQMVNTSVGPRYNGVDLMSDLLKLASEYSLPVMLIGGRAKVADKVIDCQKRLYPSLEIFGLRGIEDIQNPKKEEEERIFSIVADRKPRLIFAAFGSPATELWLYRHRDQFRGCICMSVGGAFDFLSGEIPRAPKILRKIGLEWLYRLILQPWRIKRQIRLPYFLWLVLKERIRA